MATTYKIHPAIGAARVGNSAEYSLAPEIPGGLPLVRNRSRRAVAAKSAAPRPHEFSAGPS
jgi:hypothetical protein